MPSPVEANGKLVRVSTATSIPEILEEYGCDPESIFREAGFNRAHFDDPDTETNHKAGGRLLSACVSATGCEHFGLLIGMRASASSLGIPGFMLKSASTVGEALNAFKRHHALQDQGGVPIFTRNNEHVFWGYEVLDKHNDAINQLYDITTATICGVLRSLVSPDWSPAQVQFTRDQPNDIEPYKHFYKASLLFGQEQNGILFSAQYLDHPISTADDHLFKYLEKEAEKRQTQWPNNILGNLRRKIIASLSNKCCSIESIASDLGMHKRTLHRKLREEGTSFQQEIEGVRYKMARNLLMHRTANLNEIAQKLGYSEVSAFSRAFKRWSGTTPARGRANHFTAAK